MRLFSGMAVALLALGMALVAPAAAQAAATDAVTGLTVSVAQAPGSHTSWQVTASWTANPDATTYRVQIAADAAGATVFVTKDVSVTSATLTTDALAGGQDYWVLVKPIAPSDGSSTGKQFNAPALDTTPPTGSFVVDVRTSYLTTTYDASYTLSTKATAHVVQQSLEAGATRAVLAGDGSAAQAWASGDTFELSYATAGTYTPHVLITDAYGNTGDVELPSVTILEDKSGPSLSIAKPAKPSKKASWRTVRGTTADSGVGVSVVLAYVVEKRGSVWWAYDFSKRKWLKGYSSEKKTESKSKAMPAFIQPSRDGSWKTPAIKGLTRGKLLFQAAALDANGNYTLKKITQVLR
ncbi:MAG: hypothetical protein QM572_06950 [Nocardioides sp.]|uniref:hypothetical protein n=1 Tax=Nocardioides sp. TaxID=35761 RepID=UPI0039E5606A